MKAVHFLVPPLLVALALTACNGSVSFSRNVEAAGELVTVPFDVEEFDSIDVSNAFEVLIEIGETTSVEVVTNESLVEELDIRVRDGELTIGLKNSLSVRNGTLQATVRIPSLDAVEVSGASTAEVVGFAGPSLRADVSGASDLTITGTATTINLEASGASHIDVRLGDVVTATVDLSGASSLDLETAEQVRGNVSGASSLSVPAAAQVNVDTSGASSISRP